jgi:hypothetical protein
MKPFAKRSMGKSIKEHPTMGYPDLFWPGSRNIKESRRRFNVIPAKGLPND